MLHKYGKSLLFLFALLLVLYSDLLYSEHETSVPEDRNNSVLFHEGELQMTFLDIGQGDATFIQFPNGEQMLIDCAIDARILEALGRVMPYYDKTLDYLVVTHPDLDHYGGCVDVLERFEVEHIVYTGAKKDNKYFHEFTTHMNTEDSQYTRITTPLTWDIASTTIQFLHPNYDAQNSTVLKEKWMANANNSSIVMKLDYNGKSILLTGDAEEKAEEHLVRRYGELLDVDILKGGHHGAANASTPEIIEVTTPEHVIFSSGKNNKYGHPSPRVLKRFERASSTIWRTDTQNDILLTINKDGMHIRPYEIEMD